MGDNDHFKSSDYLGVYYKYESPTYRSTCQGCGRGYHGNRWDAHHILPAVSFGGITDKFSLDCLKLTDYDINAAYSMGGLPKLTAFILYFQNDPTMPYKKLQELTVTMRRWGTVKKYQNQSHLPVVYPGNYPVHNPTNWGHTYYNKDVVSYMNNQIFKQLKMKYRPPEHPKPENIKKQLEAAKDKFWGDLVAFANGPGGGVHMGIEDNMRHRYTSAAAGWWKPMCMSSKVTTAPASPSL